MAVLPDHTISSGNLFADLGLPNAGELLIKAQIVSKLADVMKNRKLTQEKVATLTGMAQLDISNLLRGRLESFSMEKLMLMITGLSCNVENIALPVQKWRKTLGLGLLGGRKTDGSQQTNAYQTHQSVLNIGEDGDERS